MLVAQKRTKFFMNLAYYEKIEVHKTNILIELYFDNTTYWNANIMVSFNNKQYILNIFLKYRNPFLLVNKIILS